MGHIRQLRMAHSDYQALIAQGKLAEAASAMEADGLHSQAAELYQQLWDFESASRAARATGDFPTALNNQLQLRQPQPLEQLLAEIERANPQLAAQCARVGEDRGAWLVAARLYHAAEMPDAAARCLEQAGDLGTAARTLEQVGQIRRAMDLYQRHLSELEEARATPDVLAQPCFHLGRLLLRFGRHEEAIPLLQKSWSASDDDALALRAGRAAAVGLARMGYDHAARTAMDLLRTRAAGGEVPSLDECLNDPDLAPIGSDSTKVLAGRYRLGHLLGSGGMGRVYMAVDQLTERRVAVKIFTAPGGARGRDAYRRFVKEARASGQLQHPHIVNLLDFHEEMGFMVLEYMEGGTLEDRLRPRLTPAACRTVVLQVLSGLGAAHQRGIVHRDIKPSNIFFSTAGAAKLGDFGVAHLQDAGQTQTGAFVGTLAFMSPEQIRGDAVTFATDVYALGVMLFQMLTGQLPFVQPDLVTKHLTTPPPLPSSILPALGPAFDEAILRCLAKDPSQRFDSLHTLRQAVERFPHGPEDPVTGPDEARIPAPNRPQRRASDRRFVVESTVMDVAALQVLEARDTRLGRAVLLLRIAPGPGRAPLLDLILLAAGQGGESLQRVMSIDRDMGQATLETPHQAGEPPSSSDPPTWGPDEAIHIAQQIGHALAPLHTAGQVHGAIRHNQVTYVGGMVVVSLLGALEARALHRPLPSPADEVAQVVLMLGLSGAPPLVDGADLARWADQQRRRRMRLEPQQRLDLLVARALADAPPEVDRS